MAKPNAYDLLGAIHRHCMCCCGMSRKAVHQCNITGCDLWKNRENAGDEKPKRKYEQLSLYDDCVGGVMRDDR